MVERDQHLGVAEANDSARLVLADHREAEHLLIEVDGTLQVRDMNADMVDVRAFEIDVFLGDCGGSTGSQFTGTAVTAGTYTVRVTATTTTNTTLVHTLPVQVLVGTTN